jgi:hypothetical protein
MSEQLGCAVCERPIEARQSIVLQPDGRLVHAICLAESPKPLEPLIPKAMPDPICVICSSPIRPTQSIVKSDGGLVHVDCFLDHPSVPGAA